MLTNPILRIMISDNNEKPMRKRSKHFTEITESCRRWDCSMDGIAEWTFEGRSEPQAGNLHEK